MIRRAIVVALTAPVKEPSILYDLLIDIDVIVLGVIGVLACLAWVVRRRIGRRLRRELMKNGQLACLKCGHSLIGNSSGMCPACGTERR